VRTGWRVALLVVLWLLAWGELSFANTISGIALASMLLVAFPPHRRHGPRQQRSSLAGITRLIAYVAGQLVVSNVVMARRILGGRAPARPGVVAHSLQEPSDAVATLMTSIIALSPGTMTVDMDRDAGTIYVHFFDLSDLAAARAYLRHLEQLTVAAIARRRGVKTDETTRTEQTSKESP